MKTIIQFMALGSLLFASPLLAWGPNIHHSMAGKVLDHDSIKPYLPLFGLNKESIIEEATEPMPAEKYQWISWRTIQNEGKGHSGFLNNPDFTCLSLTQFAGYVLHDCSDCGVPLGHSPANELLDNKLLEAILESGYDKTLPLPSWSELPPYTGCYSDKVKIFYNDQIGLVRWFKTHVSPSGLKLAGTCGIKNGLRLGQTVLLDIFLALDPGDTNYDGRVDTCDLLTLLRYYIVPSQQTPNRGDLNGDGLVNLDDFRILLVNFHRHPVVGLAAAHRPPVIPKPARTIFLLNALIARLGFFF